MTASELPEERRAELLKTIPLGRVGKAGGCRGRRGLSGGPGAAYVTGQVLRVNGGLFM